jgi:haloacetate dehalogenase
VAASDDGGIAGFEYSAHVVGPTAYRPGVAGSGPPVLLFHGFPQTPFCWRLVAPALIEWNTVVVCDLKGCRESRSEPGGPLGEGYSKREMAAELAGLMARLGLVRFAVVGHDRGGRVAYRMALDHPAVVERLAVLNIVPVDQFERIGDDLSLDYYPWFLLAQPAPFSERLVGARGRRRAGCPTDRCASGGAGPGPSAAAPSRRDTSSRKRRPGSSPRRCRASSRAGRLSRQLG